MPRISHIRKRGFTMRVAVIVTGIAGNAAALALSKRYPITVYDRDIRPGGHSHTVTIDYDGTPLAVDIGFIVYNELNYPDLADARDILTFNTQSVADHAAGSLAGSTLAEYFSRRPRCRNRSAIASAFRSSANAFSGKIVPGRLRSGEPISARPGRT